MGAVKQRQYGAVTRITSRKFSRQSGHSLQKVAFQNSRVGIQQTQLPEPVTGLIDT
jgi:hypothetical protein